MRFSIRLALHKRVVEGFVGQNFFLSGNCHLSVEDTVYCKLCKDYQFEASDMWGGREGGGVIRGTLALVWRVSLSLLLAIQHCGMPSVHWQH